MKTRLLKPIALLLICALMFSLSGCDSLDYREAIGLYNSGRFDEAAEIFSALGDYEDSAALSTLSHYWAAITLAEEGKYEEALPRFLKLGNYEDSAVRATECTYQMALAEFEAGNYTDAQIHLEEVADYKQASEYLRRINWQTLFDQVRTYVQDNINNATITKEQNRKVFTVSANTGPTDKLTLTVSAGEDDDFLFYDGLAITLTRDSTMATFEASSGFVMDFVDGQIGSSQLGYGRLDITSCTPETTLVIETFEKHVDDNQGNTTYSTDPADSLMNEAMAENLHDLLTVIPELLIESGIELTLKDIGFAAI